MDSVESRARTLTTSLVDFLVEVTEAAEPDPLRDITSDHANDVTIVWMEELPEGCWSADQPFQDVLLAMTAPPRRPEPVPTADLTDWLDGSGGWESDGGGPQLRNSMDRVEPDAARGDDGGSLMLEGRSSPTRDGKEPPARVLQVFERFRREWMAWAAERREAERLRPFYEALEGAAKKLEQRDDEFELVLWLGLVRWVAPDGRVIRRHLLTEQVTASVDRRSAAVSVVSQGMARRLEDHQLFDDLEMYHPDRAPDVRDELISFDAVSTRAALADSLGTWLAACLDTDLQAAPGLSHYEEPGDVVRLSLSPAMILRPRSKALRVMRNFDRRQADHEADLHLHGSRS